MEPSWIKQISNQTVCNFFYAFFIIYAILVVFLIVSGTYLALYAKLPKGMELPVLFGYIVAGTITVVKVLFFYIICDRTLLSPPPQSSA
jgi:hypothetical protein